MFDCRWHGKIGADNAAPFLECRRLTKIDRVVFQSSRVGTAHRAHADQCSVGKKPAHRAGISFSGNRLNRTLFRGTSILHGKSTGSSGQMILFQRSIKGSFCRTNSTSRKNGMRRRDWNTGWLETGRPIFCDSQDIGRLWHLSQR